MPNYMKMNTQLKTFCVPLAAAVCAVFAGACQPSEGRAQMPVADPAAPFEERLRTGLNYIAEQNMPVIVGVSHQGGPIELYEFGALADDGVSAAETLIDINSITKSVTGVMAAKLIEQGKVRADETLSEIFNDVPEDKAGITLHQLLTHSSGMPDAVGNDDEKISKEAFLKRVFAHPLDNAPGEIYSYSNAGFGVVAAIIEERAGKSYEAYLREEVIGNVDMPNTGYESVYDASKSMRSDNGKTIDAESWGAERPYWHLQGNGGLISTVSDMIAFRKALAGGEIISEDMVKTVHTPFIPETADAVSFYGYGVVVQDVEGIGRTHWHDGGNGRYSAMWVDLVDKDDILFTAGTFQRGKNAFEAMEVLRSALYESPDGQVFD